MILFSFLEYLSYWILSSQCSSFSPIGLACFQYIYLISSYQDTFIPFYSERVEVTPQIQASSSRDATVIKEMVDQFWAPLQQPGCKTLIRKWNIEFDVCCIVDGVMTMMLFIFSIHEWHWILLLDILRMWMFWRITTWYSPFCFEWNVASSKHIW